MLIVRHATRPDQVPLLAPPDTAFGRADTVVTDVEVGAAPGSLSVLMVWVVIGVGASLIFGRRDQLLFLPYTLLGVVFGPLVIPVLWERRRVAEQRAQPVRLAAGTAGPGPIDVLVGVAADGDPAALLAEAWSLFGERLGRVAVARVIEPASMDPRGWSPAAERAAIELEAAALLTPTCDPATFLLPGAAHRTLPELASREGYDAILVGAGLARVLATGAGLVVLVPPRTGGERPGPG